MAFEVKSKYGLKTVDTYAEAVAILVLDLTKLDPTGVRQVYDTAAGESLSVETAIADLIRDQFTQHRDSAEFEIQQDEEILADTIWIAKA